MGEGIMFSDALTKYENIINSGVPLLANVVIDKQNEETSPRVMISSVEALDKAIADVANGIIICINDASALKSIKDILHKDRNGTNKIYIKPEHPDWDVKIELAGGFAFVEDIIGKIRSVPGVSTIKEI